MKKILMIDDDEEMCQEMSEIVSSKGYQVECVHNGEIGLKKVFDDSFGLVLLDLKMAGIGGREVLREIKTKRPDIKVIILTGSPLNPAFLGGEEDKDDHIFSRNQHYNDKVLKLADGVMNKPFEVDAVLAKIKKLL